MDALKNNMSLFIFPEGGRSEDGRLQPFMGGAFFAAIRAQLDVVPMALVGTYEVLKMNTWHVKPRPVACRRQSQFRQLACRSATLTRLPLRRMTRSPTCIPRIPPRLPRSNLKSKESG